MLSLHIGFCFVRAAVAYAILERTIGFEHLSETIAPRYLKLVTVPSFCPLNFISLWMPLALFVISLIFQHLSPFYALYRFFCDFERGNIVPALLQQGKPQTCDSSAAYANLTIMFFQSTRHNPFEKNVEKCG